MFDVRTVDDLWNHIAYVLGSAPDSFPYEDFLPDDQQMNLDSAFQLLHKGVDIAYPEDSFADRRTGLNRMLDKCYTEYKTGDPIKAGHLLNKFEAAIFKTD